MTKTKRNVKKKNRDGFKKDPSVLLRAYLSTPALSAKLNELLNRKFKGFRFNGPENEFIEYVQRLIDTRADRNGEVVNGGRKHTFPPFDLGEELLELPLTAAEEADFRTFFNTEVNFVN